MTISQKSLQDKRIEGLRVLKTHLEKTVKSVDLLIALEIEIQARS